MTETDGGMGWRKDQLQGKEMVQPRKSFLSDRFVIFMRSSCKFVSALDANAWALKVGGGNANRRGRKMLQA